MAESSTVTFVLRRATMPLSVKSLFPKYAYLRSVVSEQEALRVIRSNCHNEEDSAPDFGVWLKQKRLGDDFVAVNYELVPLGLHG